MVQVMTNKALRGAITVNVILKKDDKTYKEKHLIYGSLVIHGDTEGDPSVEQLIGQAQASFGMEPEEVMLKISLEV
jgi:hypothetical protein